MKTKHKSTKVCGLCKYFHVRHRNGGTVCEVDPERPEHVESLRPSCDKFGLGAKPARWS